FRPRLVVDLGPVFRGERQDSRNVLDELLAGRFAGAVGRRAHAAAERDAAGSQHTDDERYARLPEIIRNGHWKNPPLASPAPAAGNAIHPNPIRANPAT